MRRITWMWCAVLALALLPTAASARVLRVGTYHGVKGQYKTIQAAVKAAHPGDWILIAPGDYKTLGSHSPSGRANLDAAVLITTPRVYIRGMNRNKVIVDGTRAGPPCNRSAADQSFGPGGAGLNGILVYKADNVWVQNLTACNFLSGTGDNGNEIWWNGGDNSGKVGGHGYYGSYLTATNTFFQTEATAAAYGIFSSNWSGGRWDWTYASNFNDSDYYIGACQQVCDQTINQAWGEYSALGYSGTNSGGSLIIEHSQFDNNEDGFDTNSQDADEPSPQNGACPNNGVSPITHTHSCWVFMDNYVHDNNNPNVPTAGSAAAGPVGTGMTISGARNDTIMNNRFVHNNAWGVAFVPYSDTAGLCIGGTLGGFGPGSCLYTEFGDALIGNTFTNDGSYGHPTNGDFGWVSTESGPTDCWRGNTDGHGKPVHPASAAALQTAHPTCNGSLLPGGSSAPQFLGEILCDSQFEGPTTSCPSGPYPRRTRVIMHALPRLKTMPNPCAGVPANPWCPAHKSRDVATT